MRCECCALVLSLSQFIAGVAAAPPIQFTEERVADGYGYAFAVGAADLDADGDLDITSCDTDRGFFFWHENDGHGKFQKHHVGQSEGGWFERHCLGDINGDRRPDIAVVKNQQGALIWFEHGGQPKVRDNWKRHVITTDLHRAYDVVLVDINGDGRLDAAASAWVGNHFAWFENPGPGKYDQEWPKRLIDEDIKETRNVRLGDFNGDGQLDLLGTAKVDNMTVWYEQPADLNAKSWIRHVVDDKSPGPTHGHAIDMDGDKDADIIMALGFNLPDTVENTHHVAWYENLGQGKAWTKHVIGTMPQGFEAFAGDLDGDGDLDVAATGWGDPGSVAWFENPGDPKGTWKKHPLKDAWRRANQIIIFDADGNKRLDIAATAERGTNELRLWRNVGR